MTTKTIEDLQNQIELLVREHLTAQQRAATAAVERAFASVAAPARACLPRLRTGRRRAPAEMSGLAERLCEAVRANPGETMTVIASQVGETPRALNQPMSHLKRAGRVRSAGQRHLTRYFPMTASRAA
jgi:hypothetical protein